MKFICRVLDMVLAEDNSTGQYCILYHCTRQGNEYKYQDRQDFVNPMAAIAGYFGAAEMMMRRRVGDQLEQQGRDRCTGEPKARGSA